MTKLPGAGAAKGRTNRRSQNLATIYDVANHAGVSKMTVSRVINGETNVREDTRSMVLRAVEALNYTPNAAARSLASADSARIGLLHNNPSSVYFSEFLVGALDGSSRNAVQLALEKCGSGNPVEAQAAIHRLMKRGLAGMILPSPVCESEDVIAELKAAGISVVAVATGAFKGLATCVRIDDFKAAFEMTEYLLRQGHRRIGFVKGHPDHTSSAQRLAGFKAALEAWDGPTMKPLIAQGYFSYRSGLDAAERLLTAGARPTAVFASNDDMAAAVISVAHRKGLDVPRDLSVVGFDDTPTAATIWPELTTIRQPISEIAGIALDLIALDIRQRRSGLSSEAHDHLVPHTLVERASARAPKATRSRSSTERSRGRPAR